MDVDTPIPAEDHIPSVTPDFRSFPKQPDVPQSRADPPKIWTRPALPFIVSSQEDLPVKLDDRRVVRVGQHFLVKYGPRVVLDEGQAMLFIREHCNIPIPNVYAIFADEETHANYIVMEYVPGKTSISAQLRAQFNELRQIPNEGYYGKSGRRLLDDYFFWAGDDEHKFVIQGPFETGSQFTEALMQRYLYEGRPVQKADFYRRVLPEAFRNHPTVFTHADIQRKNIIIRADGSPIIVDWELGAWYPKYWEYFLAMTSFGHWEDDWPEFISTFLEEFNTEYCWMDTIRRELWFD
ncbi:Uu.00g008890.m01.CDS01 [Anthostomella pinea]|uniref:Uu.00g008890.m01.CDS01 n=1 Tax=Anthostomella pinea TaxID=933095 RepID=A0AAI8YPY8_9PEZI|nr:Uu.00g008890.m01.CDS01 [Anthostomella pinea]